MTQFNPDFNESYDEDLRDVVKRMTDGTFPDNADLQSAFFTQVYYLMENGMPVPDDLAETVRRKASQDHVFNDHDRIPFLFGVRLV